MTREVIAPRIGEADPDRLEALRTRGASKAPESPRRRAPRMSRMRRQESRAGVLFAMPWIIGMIVFTIGPIIVDRKSVV